MSRRATRPLNPAAVQAANDQFYANHPELVQDGRRIPLDPRDPAQAALRKEWLDSYAANGGAIEDTSPKPPQTPVQPCPEKKCDPTVTIGRVRRGNPYVPKDANAADGMPDSVPPTKTYEVEVTVTPSLESCPGQYIALSIINGSADNGIATVSPAQITKTTTVTVTGGDQTKPGHAGQLKIQAKLDGTTVKAASAGFTVCAHPVNYRDTFFSDWDDDTLVGVVVQDDWDSDSGTFADLDETEDKEVVSYTGKNDSPPFLPRGAGIPPENSDYISNKSRTTDKHRWRRDEIKKGPAGVSEAQQLCIFKCHRCGATDKVHPNSGFTRIHEVFQEGGQWKHRTRKIGAAVTIGAYKTEAGTADVTSLAHLLK